MRQVASGVDQAGDFFLAENHGQTTWHFGVRKIRPQIGTLECLVEEEMHGRHALLDGSGCQFAVADQVELKLADVLRPQLIGRSPEMLGELPQCVDVGYYGTLSVITTLELLQHHFS